MLQSLTSLTAQASQTSRAARRRPTHVSVLHANELSVEHIDAWAQIQRSNPIFDSPFFHPEFVQQIARFRDDVEVAVLECNREPIGFFPFHRLRHDVARPAGMSLSDFHGVVTTSDATFDAQQLLKACGLRAWHFNHAPAQQCELMRHQSVGHAQRSTARSALRL